MSPAGRKRSPDSKHTMMRVRLDDETVKKLNECAEQLNTSKSEVIRIGIDKVRESLKK